MPYGPLPCAASLKGRIGITWTLSLFIGLAIVLVMTAGFFSILVKPSLSGHRSMQMTSLGLAPVPRDPDAPDEREMAIRNAAYYQAFRVIKIYSLLLVLAAPILDDLAGSVPPQFAVVALMILVLMTLTLPQAVILWAEPDVPEEVQTYS